MYETHRGEIFHHGQDATKKLEGNSVEPVTYADHGWTVRARLPVRYDIVQSPDLFSMQNRDILLEAYNKTKVPYRRVVIIDNQVNQLYQDRIRQYFEHFLTDYQILPFYTSEQEKNLELVERILQELAALQVPRRSRPVIAIGGGVLLDTVGMAASLYRRGIPYVRVPTTLLALVDAAIGIKTSVNFQMHKNYLGSYYPPLLTLLDRTFLQTLDTRHICNGMAEILKVALIKDKELFELLEKHNAVLIAEKFQGRGVPELVIRHAIQGMLEELAPNLWEYELNRLMDFGHSFSPVFEMQALPRLLHGEAVAIDMAISTLLAYQRNLLSLDERDRIFRLMKNLGLPTFLPLCEPSLLYKALQETVKHRDGLQRLPLPTAIGSADFFNDISFGEIEMAVNLLKQRSD
jgi:2-epi-5-epi-valiolone synthase